MATIVGGLFALGQAQQNSVLGHLMTSAYDYVISQTLGFHVDFTKTLGQQYEEAHKVKLEVKPQPEHRFDAVIEKCEFSIKEMHRPIVWSKTATSGSLHSVSDEIVTNLHAVLNRFYIRVYKYYKRRGIS